MESIKVYEDSYKYLESLKKSIGTSNINIDLNKLDEKSREVITRAIRDAVYARSSQVYNLISNQSNQPM